MTSTFTPNKNLELPGFNDYVDSWNTPVNADFTAVDTALGGVTNLNATAVSGDVTLTSTQYRPLQIVISGTLTANVRYLIPASVGGQWTITNSTSGAFTLSVASAAGGVDITLLSGTTIVSCDGTATGMRRSISNLPVTNGGTGLTSAPTNGQLLIGNSGGGFTQATLTAGAGVSITNGSGAITIAVPTIVEPGVVVTYAGAVAPTGWLICDGAAVNRSIYGALFAIVGTTYGAGDGSTTFNLPNLVNRFSVGAGGTYALGNSGGSTTTSSAGAHDHTGNAGATTLSTSQIPAHTHTGNTSTASLTGGFGPFRQTLNAPDASASGVFSLGAQFASGDANAGSRNTRSINMDASHGHSFTTDSTGGTTSHTHTISTDGTHTHTVTPPYLSLNYIIKT
jgi:microcystin-dependent protein